MVGYYLYGSSHQEKRSSDRSSCPEQNRPSPDGIGPSLTRMGLLSSWTWIQRGGPGCRRECPPSYYSRQEVGWKLGSRWLECPPSYYSRQKLLVWRRGRLEIHVFTVRDSTSRNDGRAALSRLPNLPNLFDACGIPANTLRISPNILLTDDALW